MSMPDRSLRHYSAVAVTAYPLHVIARSGATKQSPSSSARTTGWGLLRRFAPRNDIGSVQSAQPDSALVPSKAANLGSAAETRHTACGHTFFCGRTERNPCVAWLFGCQSERET